MSFTTNITWYLTVPNTSTNNPVAYSIAAIGGQPEPLIWNDAQGNGPWDVTNSQNWSNVTTGLAQDYFKSFDYVTFDDSIAKSAHPTANVNIAAGQAVLPTMMANNSSNYNYTFSGAGKITGEAGIVKLGGSTLTISTSNDFTGDVPSPAAR